MNPEKIFKPKSLTELPKTPEELAEHNDAVMETVSEELKVNPVDQSPSEGVERIVAESIDENLHSVLDVVAQGQRRDSVSNPHGFEELK